MATGRDYLHLNENNTKKRKFIKNGLNTEHLFNFVNNLLIQFRIPSSNDIPVSKMLVLFGRDFKKTNFFNCLWRCICAECAKNMACVHTSYSMFEFDFWIFLLSICRLYFNQYFNEFHPKFEKFHLIFIQLFMLISMMIRLDTKHKKYPDR